MKLTYIKKIIFIAIIFCTSLVCGSERESEVEATNVFHEQQQASEPDKGIYDNTARWQPDSDQNHEITEEELSEMITRIQEYLNTVSESGGMVLLRDITDYSVQFITAVLPLITGVASCAVIGGRLDLAGYPVPLVLVSTTSISLIVMVGMYVYMLVFWQA